MQDNNKNIFSMCGVLRAGTSRRKSRTAGFTIVELLIVIVVIGILATITIVAYNGIQQRARDTARKSDIATIQKALELYHIDNGGYPACSSAPYQPGGGRGSCYSDSGGLVAALVPKYVNSLPIDPINNTDYRYRYFYGSKKTTDTSYSGSADDNYILIIGYESQDGPYVTQMSENTKYNYIAGSAN